MPSAICKWEAGLKGPVHVSIYSITVVIVTAKGGGGAGGGVGGGGGGGGWGQQKVKGYSSGCRMWMLIINSICILPYLVNPSLNLVQGIKIDLCFLSTCIIRQWGLRTYHE